MLSFGKINKKRFPQCFHCVCVRGWCIKVTILALLVLHHFKYIERFSCCKIWHNYTDRLIDHLVPASAPMRVCAGVQGLYVSDSVDELVKKDHYIRACWGFGYQKWPKFMTEVPFQPPLS